MAGGMNLATKYLKPILERWEALSQISLVAGSRYVFKGDKTFVIYSIPYAPLVDYSRSGLARYGNPNDLSRNIQTLTVSQDKGFTFILDKGDEFIQVEWLVRELFQDEYRSVLNTLHNSGSICECSDAMIRKYLRPADQSDAVCVQRAKFCKQFYAEFAGGEAEDPDGMPDMVQVSEQEYNTMSRAMLVVMYLKDIMEMLEEFEL